MIGLRSLRRGVNLMDSIQATVSRSLSSSSDKLLVDLDDNTGVATMKLNRPPVNSLNLEFLTDISNTLEKLENDRACRGVILTSSNNKVFCAGLDILEMYQPQVNRLSELWRTFQSVWLRLMRSRLVTIAAINGHSPAGGCVIAMTCDYRIMAKNFTIGANETLLGTVAPFWFMDTITNACGHRQANLCCQKGLLLTTDQAHTIGMVDEVVTPTVSVMERAQSEMKSWLKIPDHARQLTKAQIVKPTVDKLLANREADVEHVVNDMIQDSVQEAIGVYLEQLKKKGKR